MLVVFVEYGTAVQCTHPLLRSPRATGLAPVLHRRGFHSHYWVVVLLGPPSVQLTGDGEIFVVPRWGMRLGSLPLGPVASLLQVHPNWQLVEHRCYLLQQGMVVGRAFQHFLPLLSVVRQEIRSD